MFFFFLTNSKLLKGSVHFHLTLYDNKMYISISMNPKSFVNSIWEILNYTTENEMNVIKTTCQTSINSRTDCSQEAACFRFIMRREGQRYLPFGLSSSMVTIVAGGPNRDNLHSVSETEREKYSQTQICCHLHHNTSFTQYLIHMRLQLHDECSSVKWFYWVNKWSHRKRSEKPLMMW